MATCRCPFGIFVSWWCFICSLLTLVLGVIYILLRLADLKIHFDQCGIIQEDCKREWRDTVYYTGYRCAECNLPWRGVVTFEWETLLDIWTPFIVGLVGVLLHMTALRWTSFLLWLMPQWYTHYGVFMFITAFFANFGYCGKVGIILGIVSLVGAIFCVVCYFVGEYNIVVVGDGCGKGISSGFSGAPAIYSPRASGGPRPSMLGHSSPSRPSTQPAPRASNLPPNSAAGTKVNWPKPFGLRGVTKWDDQIKERTPGHWVTPLPPGHSSQSIVLTVGGAEGSLNFRVGKLQAKTSEGIWLVRLCSDSALNSYLKTGTPREGPEFDSNTTQFYGENLLIFDLAAYRRT